MTRGVRADPRRRALLALLAAAGIGLLASSERALTQEPSWAWEPPIPTVPGGVVEVVPVRGNVHMLVGGGGNITVHAGSDGLLMVDAGTASMSDSVIEALRSISPAPLRYIVNTNDREEHTGGNDAIAATGSTIPFRPEGDSRVSDGRLGQDRATVIAYLTVLYRMSASTGETPARSETAWPDNTYSTPQKKLYFNEEPVLIMHNPSTTDGDSIVHFRFADVISVGDLLDFTRYPVIDPDAGGSIDAMVAALTRVLGLTVPNRRSEAGTLVIPGHGRIADQPDVVYYREMLAIVRDRIQDMVARGLTLEEIKAARPTREWDSRYGRDTGPWTTEMFVEAAYGSLRK